MHSRANNAKPSPAQRLYGQRRERAPDRATPYGEVALISSRSVETMRAPDADIRTTPHRTLDRRAEVSDDECIGVKLDEVVDRGGCQPAHERQRAGGHRVEYVAPPGTPWRAQDGHLSARTRAHIP